MNRSLLAGLSALALLAAPLAGVAQADTTSTVVVSPSSMHGFLTRDVGNDGAVGLTNTPAGPAGYGPGSLTFSTPNDPSKASIFTDELTPTHARPLSELTDVSYQAYRDSTSTGNPGIRPVVQLEIWRNLNGGPGTDYTTLVFEPLYNYGADLVDNTWQSLDGNHQGAMGGWHTSKAPGTYYKTLADVQAEFPAATIIDYGLDQGSYNAGAITSADALTFVFTDGATTYDFEATDPPPALTASLTGASVLEGNTGTTPLPFTVTLNRVSTTDTAIQYATNNSSATAGSDYVATSGTLVIPAGATVGTVPVLVNGDRTFEGDEAIQFKITSVDADTSLSNTASGNILNDDSVPAIRISDATTVEGNSGTHNIRFVVRLGRMSSSTVTVNYATANGSAKAGTDYVAASGTLTFAPGTTSQSITVAVRGDRMREPIESFFVNLSHSTNATIADPNGTGIIMNDD